LEKPVATSIVKSIQIIGDHLNSLHAVSELLAESDRREFKRHLGAVMAILNADVLLPIVSIFPDLDPDAR